MNARYCASIPLAEARAFLKLYFGSRATIPHGSRCYWVAGIHAVMDRPGLHLIAGAGGMCGVWVQANEQTREAVA